MELLPVTTGNGKLLKIFQERPNQSCVIKLSVVIGID